MGDCNFMFWGLQIIKNKINITSFYLEKKTEEVKLKIINLFYIEFLYNLM